MKSRRIIQAITCSVALLALAAGLRGEPDAESAERALVRLQAREDERPWLAIDSRGHTAAVRALAFTPDSKYLCSAGLDKVVQVWDTSARARDLRRQRVRAREIRWQVARGLRGSIYGLAAAPDDGLLAIGGYGATGALGEILLVDPVQGTLLEVLEGHRQTIASLSFSADGQWLASLDMAGQAMLWRRGDWQPSRLYAPDRQVYGAEQAAAIERQARLRPIVIAGSSHVVVPLLAGREPGGQLRWKLMQIALADRSQTTTLEQVHLGGATALAASADGRRLASADQAGNLYLWDLGRPDAAKRLAGGPVVLSLAFSPQGDRLLAGTALADGKSQLQIWDTAAGQLVASRTLADHVQACAFSPDGRQIAYSGGARHAVYVGPMDDAEAAAELRGNGRRVVKVAFASGEPLYRVAFGTTYREGGAELTDYGPLQETFDPVGLNLGGDAPLLREEWLDAGWSSGRWQARRRADGGLQLYRDGRRQGHVYFDPKLEGGILSYCWIGDGQAEPTAIVVGTDLQNSIYVCRLVEQGPCPILRRFRGHYDYVTSLGASRDLRYLVSGSADGTVRFWSLSEVAAGRAPRGRWGAEFREAERGLVAGRMNPAGPLFFKGVRSGDVLQRIRWMDQGQVREETRPRAILDQLRGLSWQTQVVFEFSRDGQSREPFQLVPAWQPLASLFATSQREWAFWTPEGYYEASANGHTLFGWQVNRGLEALPDFYRADQFYKNLERPEVMEKLLPSGSLDAAFRQAAAAPPNEPDQVVQRQVEATPLIDILTPSYGETVPRSTATVRARIRLPATGKLTHAKVFANGVVARTQRLVEEQPGGKEVVYEWQAELPTDERNLIQVVAGTSEQTIAFREVVVERGQFEAAQARPAKLYLLAVGIDQYLDPAVQPLSFSVADARAVVQLFQAQVGQAYSVEDPIVLTNEEVTLTNWKQSFQQLSERLKEDARPDDLLVIFMAGHGFVDRQTRRYYYASHDITQDGFVQGKYGDSISWSDFELLADVPCRKLAFLDTCHSGAIQPLAERGLKSAIRAFQEDVVLTVTASTADERSEERREWGHGAFTKSLLEALQGKADTSADGFVTLNEAVEHVKQAVPQLTGGRQHPTAAPGDLLPFVNLRLTSVSPPAAHIPAKTPHQPAAPARVLVSAPPH